MKRIYFTCPKASDDWWYEPEHRSMTVITDDESPVDTGLVDQCGVTIYRRREREPVGFGRK